MKRSLSEGYYTFLKETPGRLLFTRSWRDRCLAALVLTVSALVVWSVAAYSLLRPDRDMPGFIFFTQTGLGLLLAALFSLNCWTEIEFDANQRTIYKRRIAFGKFHLLEKLPFEQLKRIRLDKTHYEYEVTHLKLIGADDRVWASIPGYVIHNQGIKVRQQLLTFMKVAPESDESTTLTTKN